MYFFIYFYQDALPAAGLWRQGRSRMHISAGWLRCNGHRLGDLSRPFVRKSSTKEPERVGKCGFLDPHSKSLQLSRKTY